MFWSWVALLGLFAASCGDSEEGPDPIDPAPSSIEATFSDSQAPAQWSATLTRDGAVYETIVCPQDAPTQALACAERGVSVPLNDAPDGSSMRLVVKARGFSTIDATLSPSTPTYTLSTRPIPTQPAQDTDAWDVSYGPDELERFQQRAFQAADDLGPSYTVKFYIEGLDTEDPTVYLIHTREIVLHHDFITRGLGRATPLDVYEEATYRDPNRTAMAGSLVFRPDLTTQHDGTTYTAPVLLEFFPSDTLSPEQALTAYRLLEERLLFLSNATSTHQRLIYVPAGSAQLSQYEDAEAQSALFSGFNAPVLPQDALYSDLTTQHLNPGETYGTLRVMSPEDLQRQVVSFRDILLLTRLPNALPLVGGTITEEFQTPLAHVNVSARARATPNIAVRDARNDPRIAPFIGKNVHLRVTASGFTLREATLEETNAFWQQRADSLTPTPLPTPNLERSDLLPFNTIGFADSDLVGAKAANIAELSHLLGPQAPHGFAVPFSAYHTFLHTRVIPHPLLTSAHLTCTRTQRDPNTCLAAYQLTLPPSTPETPALLIERLLNTPPFVQDTTLREATLFLVRTLIETLPQDPAFAAELNARVHDLAPDGSNVRLRSSTNAEDLPFFSGAGLYTSTSASSDPTRDKLPADRIRRVWASAWNWRAFEERAWWGMEHLDVAVGVAVHPSYPDEAANGVLITTNLLNVRVPGYYVNVQKGEVAVTNPTNGALPEIFSIIPGPNGIQLSRQRLSSLSPNEPILANREIGALYQSAQQIQNHFQTLYAQPGEPPVPLDMEFKFNLPDRSLLIKQVRPYREATHSP